MITYFNIALQFYERKQFDKAFINFKRTVMFKLGTLEERAKAHYYLGNNIKHSN